PTTDFESQPVRRTTLVQDVTASGTLSALVSVDVGSQVSGKIVALHVDFNSPVRKGQLVAQIDPTLYDAVLLQARGELASARASVVLKRQNLERKRALVPERAASQFDLDVATAELAQAEALVTIREAAVQSAAANVAFCRITAPVDGVVIARKVDIGQTVIAAMNSPVLLTIAQDLRQMRIITAVSEADVGLVREGQAVRFTVEAFPDETFSGVVQQIRKSPTTTQNVVTYESVIAVANPSQKLFPGMTADVSVRVAERTDVLAVPNTALRFTPPEGARLAEGQPPRLDPTSRLVYTLAADGQTLRAVPVQVGITDGVHTEIRGGLDANASVVTASRVAGGTTRSAFPPEPPPSN
nr:efflux RND transporter periplasmic adaptor subunit [Gemmatimonadaceae bacterium]